jgi:mono/diheme cytochrome c family protein
LAIERTCVKSPLGRQGAKPDHGAARCISAIDQRRAASDSITRGRAFVLGILVTVVVGVVVAYFFVTNAVIPMNGDAKPLPLEGWAARSAMHATLEREAPKGSNPVALSDANLIAGIGLYAKNCAICHGTAKGDASITPIAKGLYIPPPQLATDGVEDDPEGYTFWKVKDGIRWTAMPAWEGTLNDEQIWTLALFLKHMDKLPPAAEQAWQQVTN